MLRFLRDSRDPFYLLLLKLEQAPPSPHIQQEILYTVDHSLSIPAMSSFCIPQNKFEPNSDGEVRFIFYLKSNDLYPTYGYVIQLVRQRKRIVYCLLSPYYNPPKLFSIITNFLMKPALEQKRFLDRNIIQPSLKVPEMIANEKILIANGIRQLISLFDPLLIGYLIVYLVLDFHIIVTSSNFEILSLFVFSILSAIHPLIWPGVFIPVLPESMIDTILAPFPYIIGMHKSIVDRAQDPDVERHILINIEEKTMNIFPDMIKIPQRIKKSIETFQKKTSGLNESNYLLFSHYSHELILDVISCAIGKPANKPKKLYKHWNILKGCHNLEEFPQKVCQSQVVLSLMREIENKAESIVYQEYWNFDGTDVAPPSIKARPEKPFEKKSLFQKVRTRSNFQHNNPELISEYPPPAAPKARPISSVKITQNEPPPEPLFIPASKVQTTGALTTAKKPQEKLGREFDYLKQIESLAAHFATKYENGGCIDNRFRKRDFQTNAGIETPESLSLSTKINLYNTGFDSYNNSNNNNNNNNSNSNNRSNSYIGNNNSNNNNNNNNSNSNNRSNSTIGNNNSNNNNNNNNSNLFKNFPRPFKK